MEFLVHASVQIPANLDPERLAELRAAEAGRAAELAALGHLERIWRVPGRYANRGIWRAADATELHELLTSLPLFPYMRFEVEALARHPSDPGAADVPTA